jgi:hypothetical protein
VQQSASTAPYEADRKTALALALRSRIVLACAADGTVGDVAAGLGSCERLLTHDTR